MILLEPVAPTRAFAKMLLSGVVQRSTNFYFIKSPRSPLQKQSFGCGGASPSMARNLILLPMRAGDCVPSPTASQSAQIESEDVEIKISPSMSVAECAKLHSQRLSIAEQQRFGEAEKAANSFSSEHPSFVAKMTVTNICRSYTLVSEFWYSLVLKYVQVILRQIRHNFGMICIFTPRTNVRGANLHCVTSSLEI